MAEAAIEVGRRYTDWQLDGSEVVVLSHTLGASRCRVKLVQIDTVYFALCEALTPVH